jgi:hypothetical protein
VGAHWPFLSDPRRVVQKDLDIAEYTDPDHNPMIPHTIVLEHGLLIHEMYMGYWYFGRPTIEDLRQDLRVVTKKCRPDWDMTRPEMKAAWQRWSSRDLTTPSKKFHARDWHLPPRREESTGGGPGSETSLIWFFRLVPRPRRQRLGASGGERARARTLTFAPFGLSSESKKRS